MPPTETSSAVSSRSSLSSTDGGRRRHKYDSNKAKTWRAKWYLMYRPAIQRTAVALAKENSNNFFPVLGTLIESLQILAFAFPNLDWGKSGSVFGHAIEYLHFEVILYDIFGMTDIAHHGWKDSLSANQTYVMWALLSIVLALVATMAGLFMYVMYSYSSGSFTAGLGPIRTLRALFTFLCGVLFVPILQIGFSGIEIGNPGMVVIGVLILIVSLPACFVLKLVLFQSNCNSKDYFALLNTNIELIDLFLRTLLVFLSLFVSNYPVVHTGAMTLICLGAAIYTITKFPYFRRGMNAYRFCLFAVLTFAGALGTITAIQYGDTTAKTNEDLAITFFVITPFLSLAAYRLFNRIYFKKTRSLYNLLLKQDKDASTEAYVEMLSNVKFKTPMSVEMYCRFVRETCTFRKSNSYGTDQEPIYDQVALKIGSAIYQRALSQFPVSAQMNTLYGIFYGIFHTDLTEWRIRLEKAAEMEPGIIDSIIIMQSLGDRERTQRRLKNGSELDALDLFEIQNSLRVAKKRCKKIKDYVAELWKMMLTSKVDPNKVQRLITKICMNETATREIYERTLTKYSESVATAAAYAAFVDEIVRDYDEADELWDYATQVQTRIKTEMDARRAAYGDAAIAEATAEGQQEANNEDAKSEQSGFRGQQSIGSLNSENKSLHQSQHSVTNSLASTVVNRVRLIGPKERRRFMEFRKMVNHLPSNAIPRAAKIMRYAFLLFFCAPCIQLIWMLVIQSDLYHNIENIHESDYMREMAIRIPYELTLMRELVERNSSAAVGFDGRHRYLIEDYEYENSYKPFTVPVEDGATYWLPWEYSYLKDEILHELEEFEKMQFLLFFNADEAAPYFKRWTEPVIPLKIWRGEDKPIWENTLSNFDGSTEFWRHGRFFLRQDPTKMYDKNLHSADTNYHWRYIFDNFPYVYGDSYDIDCEEYTHENTAAIHELINDSWIIMGITAFIVIFVALFFIRPSVNHVFREVDMATAALMAVPKVSIEAHYGQIRKYMNMKDKKKKKAAGATQDDALSEKSSEKASEAEQEGESDSDDDLFIIEDTGESGTSSGRALFWKYTMLYAVSLLAVIATFAIETAVTTINGTALIEWGIRTDLGLRIRFAAWRIGYAVQMMSVNDVNTYPHIEDLREHLHEDLLLYQKLNLALLFGDESMELPKGRLPEIMRYAMFDKHYMEKTASTDEMSNAILQAISTIEYTPLPLLENNTDYQTVVTRLPLVLDGFHQVELIYRQLVNDQLGYLVTVTGAMFAFAVGMLLILYFGIFLRIIRGLKAEHEKTKHLLMQIPLDAIKTNYPLQVLLRGKDAAQEMFLQHEIPGVRITRAGIPVPIDSILNLSYVRRTIWESSHNLVTDAVDDILFFFGFEKKFEMADSTDVLKKRGKEDHGKLKEEKHAIMKSVDATNVIRSKAAIKISAEVEYDDEKKEEVLDLKERRASFKEDGENQSPSKSE